MHWLHSVRSNHPTAQTCKKRNIKDCLDVSAWHTPRWIRSSTKSLSNDGGRTRKGWQTSHLGTGTHKASLPRPTATEEDERVRHQKITFLMFLGKGLSKPADDVGQQAKDNLHAVERQASAGLWYKFSAPYRCSIKPFKSFRVNADSIRKPKLPRLILWHAI